MNSPLFRVLAAVLILVLAGGHPVFALAGTLERPSLAFPAAVDPAWQAAVIKVLNERPAEFIGGDFINASTTLRYKGPVESLNRFLAGLAGCAELRIHLRFSPDLDCTWKLEHNGWSDAKDVYVTVHIGNGGLPLDGLQVPVIRGSPSPALSKESMTGNRTP